MLIKNKKPVLFLTACFAVLFSAVFTGIVYASSENSENTFSFHFKNCTIAEAITEISKKSGINIVTNSINNKKILNKSYINKCLDDIITDLLRGESSALVWNYNNGNLDSIDLYTFEENNGKGYNTGTTGIRSTRRDDNRNVFSVNKNRRETEKIRNNYLKKETDSSNRLSTALSTSRTPVKKSTSGSINTKRTNMLRASGGSAINRQNSNINNRQGNIIGEEEKDAVAQPPQAPPEPESENADGPEPEENNRLEPPPMPPGL